jgi:hypothetical protein
MTGCQLSYQVNTISPPSFTIQMERASDRSPGCVMSSVGSSTKISILLDTMSFTAFAQFLNDLCYCCTIVQKLELVQVYEKERHLGQRDHAEGLAASLLNFTPTSSEITQFIRSSWSLQMSRLRCGQAASSLPAAS